MSSSFTLERFLGNRSGALASSLDTLAQLLDRLVATNTTAPVTTSLVVLVKVVGLGSRHEVSKLTLVLRTNVLDDSDSRALQVHHGTETRARLDNDVRNAHLAAEGGHKHHKLNRVNVVSNHDEVGLLGLNESNTVVQTVLDVEWLLAVGLRVDLVAGSHLLGHGVQTRLLLLLRLGAVLVHELEQSRRRVLVKRVGELGDSRGHLEALLEDHTLALETNVLRPLDKARQVALGLNVLTCIC